MLLMAGFIVVAAIVLVSLFILFVFWALNSRTAGERGWVYNRHNPRRRGGGTLGLEAMFQPSIEHVIEERSAEARRGSQDESGDPPDPGPDDRDD
jgi:hypothetical protein